MSKVPLFSQDYMLCNMGMGGKLIMNCVMEAGS